MHDPAETLDLRKRRLLGIDLNQLLPLSGHLLGVALPVEVDRSQAGNLLGKPQVAPLDVFVVGLMEDLDQARAAGSGVDRRRNHQQRRVVGRDHAAVGAGDRASRRNEQSGAAAEQAGDHRVVRGDALG